MSWFHLVLQCTSSLFVAWHGKCVIDTLSVESGDLLLFQQCVSGDSVVIGTMHASISL